MEEAVNHLIQLKEVVYLNSIIIRLSIMSFCTGYASLSPWLNVTLNDSCLQFRNFCFLMLLKVL